MSNPKIIEIDQRSDAQCWHDAIKFHNDNLEKGTSDKFYIHPHANAGSGSGREINAQDLMGTALASYQKLNEKRGALADCLLHIFSTLQRHASAIDTMVQSNPAIASLVWGSARLLLQINDDNQRASLLVSQGVLEILRHVGRWESISGIAELLNSSVIRDAVVLLYVKVLDFLVFSKDWMDKSPLKRLGSSIVSSKADEADGKLKVLRSTAEDLDKELQTKDIESLIEISSNINGLQLTVDAVLREVHHMSGPAISKLDEILQAQKINGITIARVLRDMHSFPAVATNTYLSQAKDNIDFTATIEWLSLGTLEPPCLASMTDGTCEWILKDPSFLKWKDRAEENTLWIQGFEGRGKSVMANYLQGTLSDEGHDTIFYQFQRSASLHSSTPTTLAASFACQILTTTSRSDSEEFIKPVRDLQVLSARHPLGPQKCPFNTMWNIVVSLLKASRVSFRILIDAVDECRFGEASQPSWPKFAKLLFESLQVTNSKVLLFSRPDPEFDSEVKVSHVITLNEDVLSMDILKLAEELCDELGIPQSAQKTAIDWVNTHSEGSFRWTWLLFNYLGRSMKPSDFELRLQILPPSVDDLHKKALEESADSFQDEDEFELQNSIILMVYGAQRILRTTEINNALQLRPDRAKMIIHRLCKPFISAENNILRFTHASAREFFGKSRDRPLLKIPASDADTILAQKCLATLLGKEYASLSRIAGLLKINYPNHEEPTEPAPQQPEFYDYASQYWDFHLSKSRVDCDELIVQLEKFLEGHQFAHWAEHAYTKSEHNVDIFQAFERLSKWAKGLPKNSHAKLRDCISNYFEAPYNALILSFETETEYRDGIEQWLARMSLGKYFFTAVDEAKTTQIRAEVFDGLKKLLSPDSILMLRATTDYAYTRFYAGNMRAARRIYHKVLATQQKRLEENHNPMLESLMLETMIYSGESEYLMAEFAVALTTFTTAMARFLEIKGPDSWEFLGVQLWYARCLGQLGQFETALETLQFVSQKRREQYGIDDPFDSVVRVAIGEILRLMSRPEESIPVLEEVIDLQHDENQSSCAFKLDISIAFGLSLLEAGRLEEAFQVVEKLESNQILEQPDRFDTVCEIAHLKALILHRQGKADEAIQLLQETLIQTEPDQRNRSLLWIRLDVANMLRLRDNEGDFEDASAVFDHVMRDVSGNEEPGFPDEPDNPRLLEIAERALRLVRTRKFEKAQATLEIEEVEWSRSSDFWLRVRGSEFCS